MSESLKDVGVLEEALDALAPEILQASGAPGISVAVGAGEQVVLAKGYGLADIAAARPMDASTVGPTGSDCKPYTALAAMQLVESGHLGLDVPVNQYLDFTLANPHGQREVTLRDLLTHYSGLGTTFGFCDLAPPLPLGRHLERVFAEGRTDVYGGGVFPLWAAPVGAVYQYSNTGIALAGYLVERANPDGLSFPEWVHRRLFSPLGMTSTCFPPAQDAGHVPAGILARRSVGYATLPGTRFRLPQVFVGDYPAGTALTTPSDHCRFLLSMANRGRLGGARVLDAGLAEMMITPQASRGTDPDASVGLVWSLFSHGSPQFYFGHGGEYMWGWSNVSRVWPGQRVAVTANANQWDLGDNGTSDRPSHLAGRLVLGIVSAWAGGSDPRPPRPTASARSYLAGVMVADRLGPRLGLPTRLTPADAATITEAALPAAQEPWDPEAFRQALIDLRLARGPADMLPVIQRELPDHQRELLQRQLGVPRFGQLAALFRD
jgi:CubicO group peptidase (beta-lactamase class C family)